MCKLQRTEGEVVVDEAFKGAYRDVLCYPIFPTNRPLR
jgi:hypothetical protein